MFATRLKFNPHIAFSITLSNTKGLTFNYDSTGSNYTHGDASDAHDYVCWWVLTSFRTISRVWPWAHEGWRCAPTDLYLPHPNDHAFASTFIILPYADEDPGEDLPDWNGDTIPLDFSPSTSPSSSHPNQVEDPADLVENPPDWVTLPATFLTLTLTLTLNQTFLKTTIITRLRIW